MLLALYSPPPFPSFLKPFHPATELKKEMTTTSSTTVAAAAKKYI